jgi:hypothetical protein
VGPPVVHRERGRGAVEHGARVVPRASIPAYAQSATVCFA